MDDLVRDRETPAVAAGLSDAEARQRLAKDGPNELPVSKPRSVLRLAREVASEPMFLLLVACGAIYMLLGDRQEALMLLGFVFVVMGISFVQQRRSERSLEALRDLSSPRALALRNGAPVLIAARDLVVGDMIVVAAHIEVDAAISVEAGHDLAVEARQRVLQRHRVLNLMTHVDPWRRPDLDHAGAAVPAN